jgi:hypothetical protein
VLGTNHSKLFVRELTAWPEGRYSLLRVSRPVSRKTCAGAAKRELAGVFRNVRVLLGFGHFYLQSSLGTFRFAFFARMGQDEFVGVTYLQWFLFSFLGRK